MEAAKLESTRPLKRCGSSPRTESGVSGRGFTLLELLVAITLVTIVTISLFSSLQIAFRAKATAEAAVEPSRTAELTVELLRADLEGALPANGILAGGFIGTDNQDDRGLDSDQLDFYTNAEAPDHGQAMGDAKHVQLLVVSEADLMPQNQPGNTMPGRLPPIGPVGPTASATGGMRYYLVRRVWTNLLSQVDSDPDEEILCRGVQSFNLRYFDGTDWQDSWDSTQLGNIIPNAVQLYMEIERPNPPQEAGGLPPPPLKYVRTFLLPAYGTPEDASDAAASAAGGSGAAGGSSGGNSGKSGGSSGSGGSKGGK